MIDSREHQRIIAEHGRRVANRVAFASLSRDEQRGLGDFYRTLHALYGPEDSLPEHERMRPGNPANDFDPMGFLALYDEHPYNEHSIIYIRTKGESAEWLDALVKARKYWGDWVISFLYKSLICGRSVEVFDSIADDQGEFVTVEDGALFCGWHDGWRGWTAWVASLSEEDISVIGEVLTWAFSRARGEEQTPKLWPDPGTPEATAFRAKLRGKESATPKQESKK